MTRCSRNCKYSRGWSSSCKRRASSCCIPTCCAASARDATCRRRWRSSPHVFVSGDGVERLRDIVHRGPDVIGAQPQQQFENLRVGGRTGLTGRIKRLLRPRIQPPILVVQENTAILHTGRRGDKSSGAHKKRRLLRRRHVGIPIPRRNTHRLGQGKRAESRTAPVAAGNYERLRHIWKRIGDDLNLIALPTA